MKKRNIIRKLIILPVLLLMLLIVGCNNEKSIPTNTIVDFYSVNDFHGRIVESGKEPGIAKLTNFLMQEKKNSDHEFVSLNAGDHFQDTYDSGTNRGALLARSLPLMECEAMAIGNHEFDWGIDALKINKNLADTTTFLGANIYYYDEANKQVLNFASDIAEPYKVIERGGRKIGLIGIIGEDQITSITSTIVSGLIFRDPMEIVPNLADKLRTEEGCDCVILIAHAGFEQLGTRFNKKITTVSPVTNRRYVDAVFNGHTHREEVFYKNEVAFMQAGCHGEQVSKVTLDISDNEVKTLEYKVVDVNPSLYEPDTKVRFLVEEYLNKGYYNYKNEAIGKITGCYSLSRKDSGNLLAKVTYEALPEEHKDVTVVFNNGGRSKVRLNNETLTPGLIYDALPFTNKTYVAMIKGSDLIDLLLNPQSYYAYYAPKKVTLNPNEYYKVAAIDYVLFHKNVGREYDRLPSFTGKTLYCEPKYSNELVEEYFRNNQEISYSYLKSNEGFSNLTF